MRRRVLASLAKSGYTAKDYVQDGLIAMWDGIENAGFGVHDPNATVWKDLVGFYDLTYSPSAIIEANCARNEDYTSSVAFRTNTIKCTSMEFVFKIDDVLTSSTTFILANLQSTSRYNGNFHFNYGSFGKLYFESYSLVSRCGVPFSVSDRAIHSVSSSWGNGNGSSATVGVLDGVDCLVSNLGGTGRNGTTGYFVAGGLYPASKFYGMNGRMYQMRLYNRSLTTAEIAANYAIDKARFGLT